MPIPAERETVYRILWLLENEPWLLRRKRKRPEEEIFDETETRLLLAVSEMPGFAFLEDDEKKAILKFSIDLKSYLDCELEPARPAKKRLEAIEKQMGLVLETADEFGVDLTQMVYKTAFKVVKEAWESKK